MTLLHSMTLSGSIAVIIYILLFYFTKRHMALRWHKVYLTVTIFLYIVPFQLFGVEYRKLVHKYFKGIWKYIEKREPVSDLTDITVSVFNNAVYVSNLWLYILLAVCILLSILMIIVSIKRYKKVYKGITRESEKNSVLQESLNKFCRQKSINVKAEVYISDNIKTPIAIGILHRKIVLPNERLSEEMLKDVFYHEVIHIKERDGLIKFILLVAVILNFYNPFVYYLMYRWNITAEMYCDEKVVADKNKDEIKAYANLIIDFAQENNDFSVPVLGLSIGQRQMKERILNMKRTTKKHGAVSRVLGAAIMAAVVFTSSLTTFAYEEKQVQYWDKEYAGEKIELYFMEDSYGDALAFFDMKLVEYEKYIKADGQSFFVDTAGNVYYDIYFSDEVKSKAVCNHRYVSGETTKHEKKSNGGCTISVYSAKKCSKCGRIVLGECINVISFEKCVH